MEIAIVTGSSSGFGFLTAIELAKRGFYVIATIRNVEKGSDLLSKVKQLGLENRLKVHELDITSASSIKSFKKIAETLGRVDVLVNNAGYAGAGFVEEIPLAEYRDQFETNVFGTIAVTQAVLATMRSQRKGKIINISSISGRIGFPGMSPYVASKYALEGWSECLRLEMKPFGIDVALVEPGSYQTNIWSTGKQITEKSLQKESPYYETMKKLKEYLDRNEAGHGDPEEVANLVADLSQKDKVQLRHPVGKGVKLTTRIKNMLPWTTWEKTLLRRLNR